MHCRRSAFRRGKSETTPLADYLRASVNQFRNVDGLFIDLYHFSISSFPSREEEIDRFVKVYTHANTRAEKHNVTCKVSQERTAPAIESRNGVSEYCKLPNSFPFVGILLAEQTGTLSIGKQIRRERLYRGIDFPKCIT